MKARCKMPECGAQAESEQGLCAEHDTVIRELAWQIANDLVVQLQEQGKTIDVELPTGTKPGERPKLTLVRKHGST